MVCKLPQINGSRNIQLSLKTGNKLKDCTSLSVTSKSHTKARNYFFREMIWVSLFLGDWCLVSSARGFWLNKHRVWLGPNVWKNSVRISNVSILMPRQAAASIPVPQFILLYFSLFHFLPALTVKVAAKFMIFTALSTCPDQTDQPTFRKI